MVLLQRKLYFSRIQRESNIFKVVPTFSRGVQMLISIETHITYDFPGGIWTVPIPPLDPHMYIFHKYLGTNCVRGQLDFQFSAKDFQIEEGGSQDFLIQNVSGSTVLSHPSILCIRLK